MLSVGKLAVGLNKSKHFVMSFFLLFFLLSHSITGKMRKTTAKSANKKTSVNSKENKEERFMTMKSADYRFSEKNFSHEKEKKNKNFFK